MRNKELKIALSLLIAMTLSLNTSAQARKSKDGFVSLFNGKNLDGWYLKIQSGDAELAKKVYAVDKKMVHVFKDFPDEYELNTGGNATHGLFYTNKTYGKYILKFEYKWGDGLANNFDQFQYDATQKWRAPLRC